MDNLSHNYVDRVSTLELCPEQVCKLCDFVWCIQDAFLLGAKYVSLLLNRDAFFAALGKSFKNDGEELLKRCLDRALDRQALRIHHLEAALHD